MSKMIFEIEMNDLQGIRQVHEMLAERLSNELPWEVDPPKIDSAKPSAPPEIDASKVGFGQLQTSREAIANQAPPAPPVAEQVVAPPTPPVAEQAAVPTPPAPPVAEQGELDKNGIPWDERIHSSAKTKNKDGTWKKRRGVHAGLVDQVEAELKGVKTPVTSMDNPMQVINDFIENITSAVQLGEIDEDTLFAELNLHGLSGLTDIVRQPDLIPELTEKFIPNY